MRAWLRSARRCIAALLLRVCFVSNVDCNAGTASTRATSQHLNSSISIPLTYTHIDTQQALQYLPRLKRLTLSKCHITVVPPAWLPPLSRLTALHLIDTYMGAECARWLPRLLQLHELYVVGCSGEGPVQVGREGPLEGRRGGEWV